MTGDNVIVFIIYEPIPFPDSHKPSKAWSCNSGPQGQQGLKLLSHRESLVRAVAWIWLLQPPLCDQGRAPVSTFVAVSLLE